MVTPKMLRGKMSKGKSMFHAYTTAKFITSRVMHLLKFQNMAFTDTYTCIKKK